MRSDRKARFHTARRHTYRMDLTLEFTAPVSAMRAQEVARRIMDGIQLTSATPPGDIDLDHAQIICHALGRILPLGLPDAAD